MNDRSATTTKDTLFRATSIQPATLIRTFAVGLHQGQRTWFPRKQAGHMTASRQPVQNVEKKTLANQGRPHMAQRAPPSVIATIGVGNSPSAIAVTPDGACVYVVNQFGNSVSVISTTTTPLSVIAT